MPETLHFRAIFDPPSGEFVVTFAAGPAKVEHRYLPDEFRRRVGEFPKDWPIKFLGQCGGQIAKLREYLELVLASYDVWRASDGRT